jgi:predicted O-methyltransferase YrrM
MGRGRPVAPPASSTPPAPEPAVDPIDAAIETLRATPIAEVQRRGWHFQQRDFYSALNDLEFLDANRDLWHDPAPPRGIDWDLDGQLETVARLAGYATELTDVPQDMPDGPPRFHWRNNFWTGLDALIQYGLVRDAKPRRVVETGCGWSSLLLAQALAANEAEGSPPAMVDQIEPYPRTELLRALPSHWDLHETILQRAPLSLFEELGENDICFYDGSHVAKPGSDVVWFFAEVVPRLKPGVLIHVHDIFWPSEYPDEWIFERGQTWNEQYVLQAFLMYNSDFRPVVANSLVYTEFHERLTELFAAVPDLNGTGSLWMRRVAG